LPIVTLTQTCAQTNSCGGPKDSGCRGDPHCQAPIDPPCVKDCTPTASTIVVPTETPELDAFALFGTGILGMGGYALARWRGRRRPPAA
jgi:hypothetical protein